MSRASIVHLPLAFLAVAFLPTSVWASAGGYAAIAWSPSVQKIGFVYGDKDAATAERDAISNCGMTDCQWVVEIHDGYASLAVGDRGGYGWAWSTSSEQDAIDSAISKCSSVDTGCSERQTVWSFDSNNGDSAGGSLEVSSPASALQALGGEHNYVVKNFKGYRQEESNWCWDAITKTIYHALTGAELDEAAVARMQFLSPENASDWSDRFGGLLPQDCHGNTSTACNHAGWTGTALWYLGKALAWNRFPAADDPLKIYKMIGESLSADVPVGIKVDWDSSGSHELAVYRAHYYTLKNVLQTDFSVYDPWDGDTRVMDGLTYRAEDESAPGRWNGMLSLADYSDPAAKKVLKKNCQFLTKNDRTKFCK